MEFITNRNIKIKILYRAIGAWVTIIFITALFFPSFLYECQDSHYATYIANYGHYNTARAFNENMTLLILGWLGALIGTFGWYANITLIIEVVRLFLGKPPFLILGLLGIAFATSCFAETRVFINPSYEPQICGYGMGFWMWFLCHIIIAIVAIAANLLNPLSKKTL